ncbi:hypothetical protein GQ42DRAFT_5583 [Ramicandelaber brevisporus]|nr:hypothetical protein GQ42DRAFT_5583 [Ramicandelaber brevisporus]
MPSLVTDYSSLFKNNVHLKIQLDGKFVKACSEWVNAGDDVDRLFTSTDSIEDASIFVWNGRGCSGYMMVHAECDEEEEDNTMFELVDVVPLDGLLVQSADNGDYGFDIVNGSPHFGWNAAWKTGTVLNEDDEEIEMEYIVVDYKCDEDSETECTVPNQEHGKMVLWKCECPYKCEPTEFKKYKSDMMLEPLCIYQYCRISVDGLYLRLSEDGGVFTSTTDAQMSSFFKWTPLEEWSDSGTLQVFSGLQLVDVGEENGLMKVGIKSILEVTRGDTFKLGFNMQWNDDSILVTNCKNGNVIIWSY